MKYGTTLLALGIINILTVFSGLPMGWKKTILLVTSFLIISIGWILRMIYKRRQEKIKAEQKRFAEEIEQRIDAEMEEVAEEIIDSVQE